VSATDICNQELPASAAAILACLVALSSCFFNSKSLSALELFTLAVASFLLESFKAC